MRTMKFLLAAAAAIAGSASGQAGGNPDYAAMPDDEFRAVVQENKARLFDQSCELGVPIISELRRRSGNAELESSLLLLRANCASERQDHREAIRLVDEFEQRFRPAGLTTFGLYLADKLDDPDLALARLRQLSEKGDDLAYRDAARPVFYGATRLVVRHGRRAELEDLALGMFENPNVAHLDPQIQSSVAVWALSAAARQGRIERAPGLLELVRDPSSYVGLLAMRTYEPVWPAIEERAGANLARVGEDHRQWALARLAEDSRDRDRFALAAHALYYDGRFEEAIELARNWREANGALEGMEEGDAWALNIEAYALDSLGRRAEADEVFDRLAALSPAEHSWVVNFVINRASRLIGHDRFAEGLEAAGLARTVAEEQGSTYAKMIVARDHACALEALGRREEAEREVPYLLENRDDSYELAAQALLCLDRRAEATDLIIEGLRDERMRARLVEALQPGEYELFYTDSNRPQVHGLFAESADLREEFGRWARRIPDRFLPAASLRRAALKAERSAP